jgi:hypothetical protein
MLATNVVVSLRGSNLEHPSHRCGREPSGQHPPCPGSVRADLRELLPVPASPRLWEDISKRARCCRSWLSSPRGTRWPSMGPVCIDSDYPTRSRAQVRACGNICSGVVSQTQAHYPTAAAPGSVPFREACTQGIGKPARPSISKRATQHSPLVEMYQQLNESVASLFSSTWLHGHHDHTGRIKRIHRPVRSFCVQRSLNCMIDFCESD